MENEVFSVFMIFFPYYNIFHVIIGFSIKNVGF